MKDAPFFWEDTRERLKGSFVVVSLVANVPCDALLSLFISEIAISMFSYWMV
jgi:hypothetical protein